MAWYSPVLRLFSTRALSNPDRGYQIGAFEKVSTDSGVSVHDERAMKVSGVWACVQLISNSVSSLPLTFYEAKPGGRTELANHYLVDLFHKSPNKNMKPRDFRLAMTVQMCIWHNAYAEISWINDRPVALTPLRPGRMTPFLDDQGDLTFHYATDRGVKVFAKRSILHLKGFGTDGIVGLERNNYARESLGLAVASEKFAAKQFANGGRPGGVLTFDKFLKPEQREKARELYENISAGADNANRLWTLEGGSQYQAIDQAPNALQMIETRQMQLSEIARFYGVPEVMIGAGTNTSSAWPASFEQQLLYFLNFTLQSYIDEWETGIAESLIPPAKRRVIFADHDVSEFIKMDSQAKARFLSTLVQNGLMTRNESRRRLGLPAVPGGDELTVQTNLTPLDLLETVGGQSGKPLQSAKPDTLQ